MTGGCSGASEDDPGRDGAPWPWDDRWQSLPDVGGGPVQEIGVAELDGVLYVVGGIDDGFTIRSAVWAYDIAAGTWTATAPMPMPMHHANVATSGGALYVLGGLQDSAFRETGLSWAYDPDADEWTEVAPMDADQARGAAAMGVIGDTIYLAGGLRGGASVTLVSSYHPASDTWEHDLAPLPEARDHLVGAAVDGVFYAISGRRGGIAGVKGRVDAYDPGLDSWSERAPIPTPRGGMAAGVVAGHILVAGGEGSSNASGVFAEVESYDPATDRWTELALMRTPRHGMAAVGYQGSLYVPGGATLAGFAAVATFEAFTPETLP